MARSITGIVVSDKADKTIVLVTHVRKTHPIYKKQYSRSIKYIAHDEKNEARVGDKVEVVEVRPISARKHLNLVKIIETAAISEKDTVEAISTAVVEKIAETTKKVKPVIKKPVASKKAPEDEESKK